MDSWKEVVGLLIEELKKKLEQATDPIELIPEIDKLSGFIADTMQFSEDEDAN